MSRTFCIGSRAIGPGHPCYLIAELSANHHGDFEQARALLHAAQRAGADAVKIQTYRAETMTPDSDDERYRVPAVGSPWDGRRLFDLYGQAQTPWEWHAALAAEAARLGLQFFSTAYDATAVDFLQSLDVPAYKVASFELVDLPLLRKIAATGRPVILSTGMATLEEISEAVVALREGGCAQWALLKCTSAYPAPPESMNLRTIPDLAMRFGAVVGLSDHTLETAVPAAAVALGASIIEKHLTLSRSVPGPDTAFSLEPDEFAQMVRTVRMVEHSLGEATYGPRPEESLCRLARRSLFVVRDVPAAACLQPGDVAALRPADGLHPRHLDEVIGRRTNRPLRRGTPLQWDQLEAPGA